MNLRFLTIDVEMQPMLCYAWDLKINGGYISPEMVHTPKRLLCFAWKWLDEKNTCFSSQWTDGNEGMACQLHKLLSEADVVCGWNSRRFDVPVMLTEIMMAGLEPPSPFQQLDLLLGVRKKFSFHSNRLGEVAKILDTPRKLENSGFSLWLRVMDGDEDARAEMESYNRGDVEATEAIYRRLMAWLPTHPNVALMTEDGFTCPACGSDALRAHGMARTALSEFRRYQCLDCRRWCRETRRSGFSSVREIS